MQFPDDTRLISMGKYSMLNRERRAQVERVQTIAKQLMHYANPLLQDCQQQPPTDGSALKMLEDCVRNAQAAREKIVSLCKELAELKPIAWPE